MSDKLAALAIVAIVIMVVSLVIVNSGLAGPKTTDIKTRKATHEIILILDEAHEYEEYIVCPDCGLTHYMHIKMTEAFDERVAIITLWYDRNKTEGMRRGIFGDRDPFDIFGGFGAREWPE